MMVEALQYGATTKQLYDLYAYVVMPNHVHVVWEPKISMSLVLQWLKGVTAKRAKRLLGLDVDAFWQAESYDHWIRSDSELQKIIGYVERNPVKAGLARSIESWRLGPVRIWRMQKKTQTASAPPPPRPESE